MATKLVTAPTNEPLSLQEAKTHLRVEIDDDDGLILTLIGAARRWCEEYCNRAFITQAWKLSLDDWPDADFMRIPKPPLQSVTSIIYRANVTGTSTTWTSTLYTVDTDSEPGRIWPIPTESLPTLYDDANVVYIRFSAGYGDDASDVPEPIRQAMLLLIGHWYEHREDVSGGLTLQQIPRGVEALLSPYVVLCEDTLT